MDDLNMDERFSHIKNDPRFNHVPKKEQKVHIDKRFQSMFHDKRFKLNYSMDKRGRPMQHSTSEDLKKYYDVSSSGSESEDKNEEIPKKSQKKKNKKLPPNTSIAKDTVGNNLKTAFTAQSDEKFSEDDDSSSAEEDGLPDLARGDGNVESSSSEESSEDEDGEPVLDHQWGELDTEAPKGDEVSRRLALCNMDWDRIKAQDLFILFNNFKPPQGTVKSVKVYPSEFGIQRMKEEEVKGPAELTQRALRKGEEDTAETSREGSRYHMETLRQYQLNRLRYYYAIIECDSAATADTLYTELDGLEYESSASQLDLRFVPDDVVFEQEPSTTCDKLPDMSNYKPVLFITKALQQTMVELTWDETDPDRLRTLDKAFNEDGGTAGDLSAYLASSSEEELEDEEITDKQEEGDKKGRAKNQIAKYKELLASIDENEQKKKNKDIEMEISWEPGLKEKTENLIKIKQQKEEMTVFEKYLETKKENKKQLRKTRKEAKLSEKQDDTEDQSVMQDDDDVPSDVDLNDPYFQEELESFQAQKPKKNKRKHQEQIKDDKSKAELELLLMEDDNIDNKKHFDLKNLMEDVSNSKSKKKRKFKKMKKEELKKKKTDDFEIDLKDGRFSALFSSADFNVDPSDTHFRKTKAMETLLQEKTKRRSEAMPTKEVSTIDVHPSFAKKDHTLSLLVKSVKSKTQNFKKKRK